MYRRAAYSVDTLVARLARTLVAKKAEWRVPSSVGHSAGCWECYSVVLKAATMVAQMVVMKAA